MTPCTLFGDRGDGRCVWCPDPKSAHPWAECETCGGWGTVEGFDKERLPCPDECGNGQVVQTREAA